MLSISRASAATAESLETRGVGFEFQVDVVDAWRDFDATLAGVGRVDRETPLSAVNTPSRLGGKARSALEIAGYLGY